MSNSLNMKQNNLLLLAWGIEVQERKIEVQEVFDALKNGSLTCLGFL